MSAAEDESKEVVKFETPEQWMEHYGVTIHKERELLEEARRDPAAYGKRLADEAIDRLLQKRKSLQEGNMP